MLRRDGKLVDVTVRVRVGGVHARYQLNFACYYYDHLFIFSTLRFLMTSEMTAKLAVPSRSP